MHLVRSLGLGCALAVLSACGGNAVGTEGGKDGGAGTSGSGGSGGSAGTSGSGGSGGTAGSSGSGGASSDAGTPETGSDGGVDCDAVRGGLWTLLDAAQVCDPAINTVQCDVIVAGLCCPSLVTTADAPATDAYLKGVAEARALGCDDICAVVDCASPTSGACQPDPAGSLPGKCVETY